MTPGDKLTAIKRILGIEGDSEDELLETYLSMAWHEIVSWRYSYIANAEEPQEVPSEYETTQIFAVVAGYSQGGAENQTSHSENGISRSFKYEDMIAYIRSHVIPFAKVL